MLQSFNSPFHYIPIASYNFFYSTSISFPSFSCLSASSLSVSIIIASKFDGEWNSNSKRKIPLKQQHKIIV